MTVLALSPLAPLSIAARAAYHRRIRPSNRPEGGNMPGSRVILALACAALAVGAARAAHAEAQEIRLAKQFSLGYVQFNVLDHQKLIEKHAKAAGLGDVKVNWATFNGPNVMNDALIAGTVDVVAGGVPGLVTLWAKTAGTAQEVRGISALSSQPFLLNTRNPDIK